jgi:hypothetical protein
MAALLCALPSIVSADEAPRCPEPASSLDVAVFSDLYGPAGESFQGALGFFVGEGDTTDAPLNGFGVSIDNVVIRWRETETVPDATTCGPGFCATLELQTTNFYEGSSRLEITLLEASPPAENDCDRNGSPDGTNDCNGDGNPDLVVDVTSDAEPEGEVVFLERVGTGPRYVGSIAISAVFDVPNTLFVARQGTAPAAVDVAYFDRDDGTGVVCENDLDPAEAGNVRASTAVLFPTGRVSVQGYRLTDNGDDDGFADTNETVNLFVTVTNQTGRDLDGVVARLSTNSPAIDCILQPVIDIGALDAQGPGSSAEGPNPFVFKVGSTIARASEFEELSATFTIGLTSDRFDATIYPIELTLDLDLDVSGGGTPSTFAEGFDTPGSLGSFTSMSLDFNGEGGPGGDDDASDGYRCQYNDPDFVNANSYAETQCHLGNAFFDFYNTFDWHQHDGLQPDGGRAFQGSGSLHFGVHDAGGDPDLDTTSLATLDAVRSIQPIDLAYAGNGGPPELSFKHQISLVDNRSTSTPAGETSDRGIVQIQLADALGQAVGDWTRLEPYQNVHDAQGTDNFVDCTFDPIDDGNDEDSFFDPTDPNRRLGPSSTCFPLASFAFLGDTDHRNAANPSAIGRASDGPGLAGAVGNGTWVESRFDLSRYQGRRVLLRFLETSIEVNDIPTYESAFVWNPVVFDDGWYIDEVVVSPTLTAPATVSVDTTDNSSLPGCGSPCTTLAADLRADPTGTAAPAVVTELSAQGSSADRCIDGTLEYQFWIDANEDGVLQEPDDLLLRDWTDNPLRVEAPRETTVYGVRVRCSSGAACQGTAFETVVVQCPSTGNARFDQAIAFEARDRLAWSASERVDAFRGSLNALRAASSGGTGDFGKSLEACLLDGVEARELTDAFLPAAPGDASYYLVRSAACNAPSWSTAAPGEVPGRNATIPTPVCP